MTHEEIIELLKEKGFESGWALLGQELTVWEHEQDPPKPLTKPDNA
jgi:hypothetical protein